MGRIKQMWLEEMEARGMDPIEQEYEDEPYDVLLVNDQNRQFLHRTLNIVNMTPDEIEFRYERRGDVYMLKSWHNGTEKVVRGGIDETPDWLARILSVSVVGGHMRKTTQPPPDEILWFRADRKGNLTTFIDLGETQP